jgi:hypothetical protein
MGIQEYTPESFMIVHNTNADFSRRPIQRPIILVQYDALIPVVKVLLYKNGDAYSLPDPDDLEPGTIESINMKVRWSKKDKTYIYKDILGCNEDRNAIYFSIDKDISGEYGLFEPILELIIGFDQLLYKVGSSPIPIIFDRNPVQVENIVIPDPEGEGE